MIMYSLCILFNIFIRNKYLYFVWLYEYQPIDLFVIITKVCINNIQQLLFDVLIQY